MALVFRRRPFQCGLVEVRVGRRLGLVVVRVSSRTIGSPCPKCCTRLSSCRPMRSRLASTMTGPASRSTYCTTPSQYTHHRCPCSWGTIRSRCSTSCTAPSRIRCSTYVERDRCRVERTARRGEPRHPPRRRARVLSWNCNFQGRCVGLHGTLPAAIGHVFEVAAAVFLAAQVTTSLTRIDGRLLLAPVPVWKSNLRAATHRRDVVPVAASARWRGGSRRPAIT